ncbi:MAG TPA: TolC family protein, partial [Steroidobacteraceae bacterium]
MSVELHHWRAVTAACAAAAAALLCGCTVGPNFHRPAAPQASAYRPAGESSAPGASAAAAQRLAPAADAYSQRILLGAQAAPEWWKIFESPQLDELMRRAIADNPDLAAAKDTLAQAHELVAAQSGQRYPQVGLQAGTGRQKYGSEFLGTFAVAPFTYEAVGASVRYVLDYDG